MTEASIQRCKGAMVGLAVGDALGTTIEFKRRGTFTPIETITGGGPFNLLPGQWTDDTSMALCMAISFIERRQFHAYNQMMKYVSWWKSGYMSCNGTCFDIGYTTSSALQRFLMTKDPYAGVDDPDAAGNGGLMRLVPAVIATLNRDIDTVINIAKHSTMLTHGAQECIDASGYFAVLLYSALHGASKEELKALTYSSKSSTIAEITTSSFIEKRIDEIKGTGYVAESLEAALWCFYNTNSYKDAVLTAANLGDDADTTAAICGQLAGAFYGIGGIPQEWLDVLYWEDQIEYLVEELINCCDDTNVQIN